LENEKVQNAVEKTKEITASAKEKAKDVIQSVKDKMKRDSQ
jgi:hypothetical protein